MRQRNKILAMFLAVLTLLAWSCKKDDDSAPAPEPKEEEKKEENLQELITTVRLTFTNQNDLNDVVTVQWQDLDGMGGNDPVVDSLKLKSGVIYNLETEFLDEVNNNDVTQEIKDEGTAHQVFYIPIPNANFLDVVVTDKDADNQDLGLEATATPVGAVDDEGLLRVVLKHQPGSKDGNINTGTTDIAAEFPVKIIAP